MFIYGENDPWSAGAFELGWAKDSFRYFVPGGNHGSAISTLPDTERDAAFATLARWAGVELSGQARKTRKSVAVEDWGIDRERRLPL